MSKSLDEVWYLCIDILQDRLEPQHLKMWINAIRPIELSRNVLLVVLPGESFYEHIKQHYAVMLDQVLQQVLGKGAKLEYSIKTDDTIEEYVSRQIRHVSPTPEEFKKENGLNPIYRLDAFVTGNCNSQARLVAAAVSQAPGAPRFNPFVIHGKTGLGKSHLAQAVGHAIKEIKPPLEVLYIDAFKFGREFEEYRRLNVVQDFMEFYKSPDVLIIDDIQSLNEANAAQDALLDVFNHLHRSGRQLILTSDHPPKNIKGLQIRLQSRLQWGQAVELTSPDYETRIKIIQLKCQEQSVEIPEEVVFYLASDASMNIRELEGAVIALLAQSTIKKKHISLDLMKRVIRHFK